MIIFFGADHAGALKKKFLSQEVQKLEIPFKDCGVSPETNAADYPDVALKVAQALKKIAFSKAFGVLICKSGIGMAMAANRFPHVRAALCLSVEMAYSARAHNNANVLCLGDQHTSDQESLEILKVFLETAGPTEERHLRRVAKMSHFSHKG